LSEIVNSYNILIGKPEEKKLLCTSRRRWKDIIKMDLRYMCNDVDWVRMAKARSGAASICFIFICGLFNDAVISSDSTIGSIHRLINE
jgi:hypothetical protein